MSGKKKQQTVILLGQGRSGSNLITTALQDVPDVIFFRELFGPAGINWGYPELDAMPQPEEIKSFRFANPLTFLQDYVFKPFGHVSTLGFKLFYSHLENKKLYQSLLYLIQEKPVKILHVQRKNLLKQYASAVIAQKTEKWEIREADEAYRDDKIYLDPEGCLKFFQRYSGCHRRYGALLDRLNVKVHVVYYEDLSGNYTQCVRNVLKFLKLPEDVPPPKLQKQRRMPISKFIANYRSLEKRFRDTQWHRFFAA